MVFYGVHNVRGVRGVLLNKGSVVDLSGEDFRVDIVLFLFKTEEPK